MKAITITVSQELFDLLSQDAEEGSRSKRIEEACWKDPTLRRRAKTLGIERGERLQPGRPPAKV